MRKFQVTVNGNTYEVEVAEVGAGEVVHTSAPKTNTVAAPAPAAAAPVAGAKGQHLLEAPMQGKIVAVKVNVGQDVKAGDVIAVLEAMKMENELVAPTAGKVVSVNVAVGQMVEAGDLIASLN